jgi:hypothetical protein
MVTILKRAVCRNCGLPIVCLAMTDEWVHEEKGYASCALALGDSSVCVPYPAKEMAEPTPVGCLKVSGETHAGDMT